MKYFLDTEFIEGTQKSIFNTKPTIDLISIGIVAEDGREYYAISKDFNLKEAWNRYDLKYNTGQGDLNNLPPTKVYWLRENVLKPIWKYWQKQGYTYNLFKDCDIEFTYREFKRLINKYGKTNKQIAEEIKEFLAYSEEPELHPSDYNSKKYNWNFEGVEFYGYYSDYDWVVFCWLFGKMIDLPKGFPMYCRDLKQTLDELQDKYSTSTYPQSKDLKLKSNYPKQTNEHSAIHDARWTYELYKFLNTL